MAEPEIKMSDIPTVQIEHMRNVAAAGYLKLYCRLMARTIGVDDSDDEGLAAMAIEMVEPLNTANEAIWRALMKDKGWKETLQLLRKQLEAL